MSTISVVTGNNMLLIFFPNVLSKIIRGYVAPVPNHSLMYSDMQDIFMMDCVVESNSPKNRKRLFDFLQKNKIKYEAKNVGYTDGLKTLMRDVDDKNETIAIRWNIERVAKHWLPPNSSKKGNKIIISDNTKEIFDSSVRYERRLKLLNN